MQIIRFVNMQFKYSRSEYFRVKKCPNKEMKISS